MTFSVEVDGIRSFHRLEGGDGRRHLLFDWKPIGVCTDTSTITDHASCLNADAYKWFPSDPENKHDKRPIILEYSEEYLYG